jgi:hypothetical protein
MQGQGTATATAVAENVEEVAMTALSGEVWFSSISFDPKARHDAWEERRAVGKERRKQVPA